MQPGKQKSVLELAEQVLERNRARNQGATFELHDPPKSTPKSCTVLEVCNQGDGGATPAPAMTPLQQASQDFALFCLAHELTLPGSICRVKADRRAPMDACTGWRIRMGKADLVEATQALAVVDRIRSKSR
jgi:hypothetical protein